MEYAASVGLDMDPWQALVLEGALGEEGPVWASLEAAVVVSRQNGKGAILEARELAGIELFGERLVVHTSHLMSTSGEALLRMEQIIESSPDLDRQCAKISHANGKEGIKFRNGARIKYMARSRGSGRGLSGDLVVFDEAMFLEAQAIEAMIPALSAAKNPQLWYAASAGFPDSTQLISVRERAKAGGDPSLAYFEWSADEDADIDDPKAWEQANPALGIRLTERFMHSERAALSEVGFSRERLGIWDEGRHRAVIDPVLWKSLADPDSQLDGPCAFAVDVTPDRKKCSIAVVGPRRDKRLHIEVVDNRNGTDWAVDALKELKESWHPLAIALDRSAPAGSLAVELEAAGIDIVDISGRAMTAACGGFYDDVTEKRVRHLGQTHLSVALGAARTRPVGDAWAWHRRDLSDISPLVAATLARHAFMQFGTKRKSGFVPSKIR